MKTRPKRKIFIISLLLILVVGIAGIFICDLVIKHAARGKLYDQSAQIPYRKTGILLGTSKYLNGGYLNPYYHNRIEAAFELIEAGKISYLVISGDNGRVEYNEPEMMRQDLISKGTDSAIIFLDYAGFRTFDSMVRLREIFSQQAVTVISQPFHNERAIYIAGNEDIDAIGFNAKEVDKRIGYKVKLREKLARVKLFADYLFGTQPKFLGPKVMIP